MSWTWRCEFDGCDFETSAGHLDVLLKRYVNHLSSEHSAEELEAEAADE